jgi:hypothetical protein
VAPGAYFLHRSIARSFHASAFSGAEFYEDEDSTGNFWRLDVQLREKWEAKAQVHNRKAQRFWVQYLNPITYAKLARLARADIFCDQDGHQMDRHCTGRGSQGSASQ